MSGIEVYSGLVALLARKLKVGHSDMENIGFFKFFLGLQWQE